MIDTLDTIIRSLYAERRMALREWRVAKPGPDRDRYRSRADDLDKSIHDLQLRETVSK